MKGVSAEIRLFLCCSVGKDGGRFVASDGFPVMVARGRAVFGELLRNGHALLCSERIRCVVSLPF